MEEKKMKNKRMVELYLEEVKAYRTNDTYMSYSRVLKEFMEIAGEEPFTRSQVTKYVETKKAKGNKESSINVDTSVIHAFSKWICAESLYEKDFANVPRLKADTPSPKFLSVDEAKALTRAELPARMHSQNHLRNIAIIRLFTVSACRVTSLCSLTLSDVDFEKNTIFFRHCKNNKQDLKYVGPGVIESIQNYVNENKGKLTSNGPLFVGNRKVNGEWAAITRQAVFNIVKKYTASECSNSLSPHDLRHTSASIMLEHGVPKAIIQEHLVHANATTTEVYTHRLNDSARQDAVRDVFDEF